MSLLPDLRAYVSSLDSIEVSNARKLVLDKLVRYVQQKVDQNLDIRLNFICTHNSRRSHLSQIWAQSMAYYFDIKRVSCYSGGTETTALFPMVAHTLAKKGFSIDKLSEGINPIYGIKYAANQHPIIGFSKTYDDSFNPRSDFAAIMTCSHADENCPMVLGAEQRIPITYEDPKLFDDTDLQVEKYQERSHQIASEMYYVFSHIQSI